MSLQFIYLLGCILIGKAVNKFDPSHKWDKVFVPCSDTIH